MFNNVLKKREETQGVCTQLEEFLKKSLEVECSHLL